MGRLDDIANRNRKATRGDVPVAGVFSRWFAQTRYPQLVVITFMIVVGVIYYLVS
jgi:hypothetical protein